MLLEKHVGPFWYSNTRQKEAGEDLGSTQRDEPNALKGIAGGVRSGHLPTERNHLKWGALPVKSGARITESELARYERFARTRAAFLLWKLFITEISRPIPIICGLVGILIPCAKVLFPYPVREQRVRRSHFI